jgi:hypothetical protein
MGDYILVKAVRTGGMAKEYSHTLMVIYILEAGAKTVSMVKAPTYSPQAKSTMAC